MTMLDNLLAGNNVTLTDKDIAFDMLKDSKFGISSLAKTSVEAVNPRLRDMLDSQLATSVKEHHRLSDMMINKGWYPAFSSPEAQLRHDAGQIQDIKQQ
jgi:similar to spore coat protein